MMLNAAAKPQDIAAAARHMTGMLWYQMLEAMNANGLSAETLGTGGSDFQSMFLWNLAQNDFGKYDSGLRAALLRQLGGAGQAAPGAAQNTGRAPESATPLARILPRPLPTPLALEAGGDVTGADTDIYFDTDSCGNLLSKAKSFARAIWPQITEAAQLLGVPPVAVLAQTALETGWGAFAPGNNLFGIKAAYGQPGSARATHEVVDGVLTAQTANFRDYASPQAAVDDYVGLIQSGYGNAAGQNTVSGYAEALQQGGYATDPSYAAKIVTIARSPLMAQVLRAIGGSDSQASETSHTNQTGGP